MTGKDNKEDNINSLCKKYFTPELCDEPVNESKKTLKGKILTELINYGDYIVKKKFETRNIDFSIVVIDTIEKCWEKWEAGKMTGQFYSTYFASSIKSNCVTELKKKENSNLSANNTYNRKEDEPKSIYETTEDERYLSPDIYVEKKNLIFTVLRIVENAYRNKERKKHKTWLSPVITLALFDALQKVCNSYGENLLQRYSFADPSIYKLDEKPTRKAIAKSLGYDEGYLKKELEKFFAPIEQDVKKLLEI